MLNEDVEQKTIINDSDFNDNLEQSTMNKESITNDNSNEESITNDDYNKESTKNIKIMPMTWWFLLAQITQDGKRGYKEGRQCNVLSKIVFKRNHQMNNWYSDKKLEEWQGIKLDDNELIVELNVNMSNIIYLPESIGLYINLKKLIVNSNDLTFIPDSIYYCTNLTHINLYDNMITQLGESICYCRNLISLRINKNYLTKLPNSISLCKNLKILNVNNNRLTELPISIGLCKKLKLLNISYNNLMDIPKSIELCTEMNTMIFDKYLEEYLPEAYQSNIIYKREENMIKFNWKSNKYICIYKKYMWLY